MGNRSKEELKRLQAMPLDDKLTLTRLRIQEFYEAVGGAVYASFSGGKDSTVLLDIVRNIYPNVKAAFCMTGLEFPEVVQHVKTFDNVDIIRPDMTFKQAVDTAGWSWPSKEISDIIYYARQGKQWAIDRLSGKSRKNDTCNLFRRNTVKWAGVVDAPFKISKKCCYIMKKSPFFKYTTRTGLHPYVGNMASESLLRVQSWKRYGCNIYSGRHPKSAPMSFWTEQDVLQYILDNGLKIPSVYGDIKKDDDGKLYTTGEQRTGCIFCPCGCHLEKGDKRRFIRLHKTHPKLYNYCMNQLGMKPILDYIQQYTGCERLY